MLDFGLNFSNFTLSLGAKEPNLPYSYVLWNLILDILMEPNSPYSYVLWNLIFNYL